MIERTIEIPAADGVTEALLVHPDSSDPLPPSSTSPTDSDTVGVRRAVEAHRRARLRRARAQHLLPGLGGTRFPFEPILRKSARGSVSPSSRAPLTTAAMERDGSAYVDFLASQPFVGSGPIGVIGFCFRGKVRAARRGGPPERIAAAASFHGGGLFTDTVDSPHLVLPRVKAHLYFGHASNDAGMNAEQIEKFEWALRSWGGDYQSEMYDAKHGWMIPGGRVYDPDNAERGFDKLMHLLDDALQSAAARLP